MAIAHLFRIVALLVVEKTVHGAYTCPSGWEDKSGTPKCAGAMSSTCSTASCCDPQPTCADFSAGWLTLQLLGQGCVADNKFFDTKRLDVEVVAPAGDNEVKAACCTAFADAKCSDWATVKGSCPSGEAFEGTNSAPPDGSDGTTLTTAKYHDLCCVEMPKTCSYFSSGWVTLQFLGQGCAADTKFFDTKRLDVEVASPAGDDEVKAACCTAFADAKCSDWATVLGSCPSGVTFEGTNSAPPDGSDGTTLTTAKYHDLCCVEVPKTCSYFSAGWVTLQWLGQGCAADTKFFDTKRLDVEVASPAGDDEVKAACCTAFADAKCSDWVESCATGTFIVNTNSAPPDGSDGKTLGQDKFRELCCETPMECAEYTTDISSSVPQTIAPLAISLSAIISIVAA